MISLAILVKKNLLTQSISHLKVETHGVNTHKSVHVTCAAGDGVFGKHQSNRCACTAKM